MTMHNPAHPGVMLKEGWLTPLGISITDAANRLGITRKHLSNIINGNANVTADVAKRLELFTGSSAKFWLNIQAAYDIWQLRDTNYDISQVG